MSRRTDTQPKRDLPDAGYNEQAAYQDAQQMPMQGAGPAVPMMPPGALAGGGGQMDMSPVDVIPFGAPSQMPDQPVTAGAPLGPGMGPEGLGMSGQTPTALRVQDVQRMQTALPILEFFANLPESSPGTRALVRWMKGTLGR